ncbi:MAG: SPOR domain-containing protein [Thermochromatium sp.]
MAPTHEAPEDGDSRAPSVQPIPQPTFTYERILKDTEVDISQGPPLPPPAPRRPLPVAGTGGPSGLPPEEPAPPPESGEPGRGTFMVQVASFSRLAEAERLRARLAQLGIMTSIQTATLQNGKTTYRVRTGGYASRAEAEEIQMQLKRQGHDSLMIPIR